MTESAPVVWMKYKYLEPKTRGRYKGGSNSSSTKRVKRSPNRNTTAAPVLTETVLVLSATGKRTWMSRPKAAK